MNCSLAVDLSKELTTPSRPVLKQKDEPDDEVSKRISSSFCLG